MRERSPAVRQESETAADASVKATPAARAFVDNRALAAIFRQEQPAGGGRVGLWGRDANTRRLYLSLLPPARSFEEIASYVYGDSAQTEALRAANAGLADPVPPGSSVQLVDGTLGAAAKAEVERDAASGVMPRTSGVAAGPPEGAQVFRVSLGGAEVELTEPQMAGLLAGMARKFGLDADRLRGNAEIVRDIRKDHEENSATWVRWASDTLGGADLPDADFANRAIETMTAAKTAFDAAASGPVSAAQASLARGLALLQEGVPLVDEAERTWSTYINGTIGGAGVAERWLTGIRNGSFAVAAGLAGAFAAPAVFVAATGVVGTGVVGTTASAGAGLVAAAGAGSVTKGALETAGAVGGELVSMTAPGDQQFDAEYVQKRAVEGVTTGAVEGIYGGVGSFIAAGLAARMTPEFLATLGGRITLGAATGGIVGLGGAGVNIATGASERPWWQELLFGAGQGVFFGALPIRGLYKVKGQPYTPEWMSASPFAPRPSGQGQVQLKFQIVSENTTTGEITAIGRSPATGEAAVVRLNPATGAGSATMTEGPRAGLTVPIVNGKLQAPPAGLLPASDTGVPPTAQPQPEGGVKLPGVVEAPRLTAGGGKLVDGWLPEEAVTKIPSSWGSGSSTKKGVGLRWFDPKNPAGNGVRIDQGDPGSSLPSQQVDHVVVRSEGRVVGRDGKPISSSIKDDPTSAHIPLSEWLTWTNWNAK